MADEDLGQIEDMSDTIVKIGPALGGSVFGLFVIAYLAWRRVMAQEMGSDTMIKIAKSIKEGARPSSIKNIYI